MEIKKIKPFDIKIPDVRVTSTWDQDMLDMFRNSIEKMGMQQPLLLVKEKDTLWLVDGLHRLDEAKMKNWKSVDCVIMDGKLKDVQMRNLALNRLRGKTKASEMVAVINDLFTNHKVSIDDIVDSTGLKRDYIEKMLAIASAHREVWQALDNEEIGVGHAFELARISDAAVQLKLLHQARVYKLKIADLKEIVDEALDIIKLRAQAEANPMDRPVPKPRLATCSYCGAQADPSKMAAPITCMSCYGYLMGQVQQAKLEDEKEASKATAETTVEIENTQTGDTGA